MPTWTVGDIEITRVADPGFELLLPQDDATRASLADATWLEPCFLTADGSLRIGSSATIVASAGAVVLVDPFLAFDDPQKLGPRLTALRDVGLEADEVDIVVNTHVDGLGVNLLADGALTFPSARYLVPRLELEAIRDGRHGQAEDARRFVELWESGRIEATSGDEVLAPGVRLEDAPGHNPGHHVVWIRNDAASAVIVGHLFLHPAQIARPEVDNGDLDPAVLTATRQRLLAASAEGSTLLIGPLFAAPGAGIVQADRDGFRLAV